MVEKRAKMSWGWFDVILLCIQLVLYVFVVYYLEKLLPTKFCLLLIVVLFVLFFAVLFGMRKPRADKKRKYNRNRRIEQEKKHKAVIRQTISRIVSILLCIAMSVGCVAARKGFGALNSITSGKYQTHVISVVVKEDSAYNEISDLNDKNIGVVQGLDAENTATALEEIQAKENVSLNTSEYMNMEELANSLLGKVTDAIIFNEAYRGMLEETHSTFDGATRIIYQYEVQEELEIEEIQKEVTQESFNIYLSGIDTYGPVSAVSRSDVNMIVTVNPQTKEILMTSVPRDYYVELASFGAMDKLTHAGIYGVEESMKTLEKLFGIEIDYYARLNFASLIKIVDALGGVTVHNDQAFTSFHTHDYYPEGDINMDGETALEFVRERYGLSGGDNDRIKNQQKLLAAMIEKAISPAIIKNYSGILNAVSDSVVTNMSSQDIQELIQMQLDDMSPWTIEQQAVTGTGSKSTECYSSRGSELYVMKPDYESVQSASTKIDAVESGK